LRPCKALIPTFHNQERHRRCSGAAAPWGDAVLGRVRRCSPLQPHKTPACGRGDPRKDPLGFGDLFIFLQRPSSLPGCCHTERGHLRGPFLMEERCLPFDSTPPGPHRMARKSELVHPGVNRGQSRLEGKDGAGRGSRGRQRSRRGSGSPWAAPRDSGCRTQRDASAQRASGRRSCERWEPAGSRGAVPAPARGCAPRAGNGARLTPCGERAMRRPGLSAATGVTESPNHRMVGVGRDLCGSSSPTPCRSRVTYSRL